MCAACRVCVLIIETLWALPNEYVWCENLPAWVSSVFI